MARKNPPFSRRPGKEKAGNRSMISCSVVPPMGGRDLVFKIGGGWPDNESIKVYGFTSQ